MQLYNTVCFTGHRPSRLGGYDESNPTMTAVKERLGHEIDSAIRSGYITFISGMSLGVDMIAAELVLERRASLPVINLVAAVPFIGQANVWPVESQRRWSEIMAEVDDFIYVSRGGYSAWKMQARNRWMVDHSSLVIAVWDGSNGGTANCVKYAQAAEHKPQIIHIKPGVFAKCRN